MLVASVCAVMATGFPTASHNQPSSRRCCARILFLRFLVLVVGCSSPEGIYIPLVDSAYYRSWHCCHLCQLSPICGSILGSWGKLILYKVRKETLTLIIHRATNQPYKAYNFHAKFLLNFAYKCSFAISAHCRIKEMWLLLTSQNLHSFFNVHSASYLFYLY